ncbi:MAG: hypothetical protein IJO59_04585 [Clostridia bacterium]|nr:hypothetical protein [Clostridia bacterium]
MLKNVIKEIQQRPLGYLTVICARPGDGRRTFSIELANDLVTQGFPVCYCSITRTKKNLQNKLLPAVHILNVFPRNCEFMLKRLSESARVRGAVVLVDDLSSFVLQDGLKHATVGTYNQAEIQKNLLMKLRELAIQRGLHIVVTETFPHASDTDDMLPISKEARELCDRAYILYKDSITEGSICNAEACMLKLKKIK